MQWLEVVIVKEISSLSLRWGLRSAFELISTLWSLLFEKGSTWKSEKDKDCCEKITSLDSTDDAESWKKFNKPYENRKKKKKLNSNISDYTKLLSINKCTIL